MRFSYLKGLWLSLLWLFLVAVNAYGQNDFVFVNNDLSTGNTVSAFSITSNGVFRQIVGSPFPTGGLGTDGSGFFATNRITNVMTGNFLFVANTGSNSISAFTVDPLRGTLRPVPGSPFSNGPPGNSGIALTATQDGRFLFASSNGAININVYSIAANGALTQVVSSPFIVGAFINSMRVTPNGRFLVVSLTNLDAIAMFTITGNGTLIPVPGSPFLATGTGSATGIEINSASNLLFVGEANSIGTVVDVFNINSNGVLTPIPGSPFTTFRGGINSNIVKLSPDERFLFVSNQISNAITVFNVSANGSLRAVAGSPFPVNGDTPVGLATNRAGTLLFTVNLFSPSIEVFNVASNGVLSRVPRSPFRTNQADGATSIAVLSFGTAPQGQFGTQIEEVIDNDLLSTDEVTPVEDEPKTKIDRSPTPIFDLKDQSWLYMKKDRY
ncbi:MAG: beta-propeller fold lactonase family protein [Acidobacteriota bacterium]